MCSKAALTGKTVHFGRVFPLCHIKHSELAEAFQKYKGRVVFGGNQIRDEHGVLAVFNEQGASASSMVAGDNKQELDFNAVQRGDAEMLRKVECAIRACTELGEANPIVSIHDQGAGGAGKLV